MRATGRTIYSMAMAKRSGPTTLVMRESITRAKSMVKAHMSGPMGVATRVTGTRTE